MNGPLISYYLGIAIVFATHLYILYQGGMDRSQSIPHAWINLGAGLLIAYYFMTKEKMI